MGLVVLFSKCVLDIVLIENTNQCRSDRCRDNDFERTNIEFV